MPTLYDKDWLQDPLTETKHRSYKPRKLKNQNNEQSEQWEIFHFATRLKLDGADFFCRQALGAASMPDDLGLPLLAHRQQEWYLDAFFFELMAACDTLLQELNIVYAYDLGLKPEGVRWNNKSKNKFMKKLPEEIFNHIEAERKKDWFCKAQWYRNTATHHYTVTLGSRKAGFGDEPLDYSEHQVSMHYLDDSGNLKSEDINQCIEYLRRMVKFISHIWTEMALAFE